MGEEIDMYSFYKALGERERFAKVINNKTNFAPCDRYYNDLWKCLIDTKSPYVNVTDKHPKLRVAKDKYEEYNDDPWIVKTGDSFRFVTKAVLHYTLISVSVDLDEFIKFYLTSDFRWDRTDIGCQSKYIINTYLRYLYSDMKNKGKVVLKKDYNIDDCYTYPQVQQKLLYAVSTYFNWKAKRNLKIQNDGK